MNASTEPGDGENLTTPTDTDRKPGDMTNMIDTVLRDRCLTSETGTTTITNGDIAKEIGARTYVPGSRVDGALQATIVTRRVRKLKLAGMIRCEYLPRRVITWLGK